MPEGLNPADLDPGVRSQLRSLAKENADAVAGHLLMTADLLDDDSAAALEHARAARRRAPRVGAVREALGIAAYRAGEWAEARMELRTARRITGDAMHLPLLADCERALGHPERALKLLDEPAVSRLDRPTRVELLIVGAGARRDLGQPEAALRLLEREPIVKAAPNEVSARLWFVYADTLAELGRTEEAVRWFAAAADADPDDETGASQRLAELLD